MNLSAAMRHLFSALDHVRHASQRTRDMIARALARLITLVGATHDPCPSAPAPSAA